MINQLRKGRAMIRVLVLLMLGIFAGSVWAESEMRPVLMGVALNVSDIGRSEKYYSEIFNLKRTFQYPPSGGPIIEIGLGNKDGKGGSLLLARFSDDPLPEAKSRYGRIVFNVKDADAIAKRAEERGSVLRELGLPRGPGKPILIFFNDPDGYEVELYQAP